MIPNFKIEEWLIVEEGFDQANNRASESIFSIGNGHMGQRANFEEKYSGNSLPGSYIAGVYYPDKTRVGWWKNGYPEYFAKVLNSPSWTGIEFAVNGEEVDLARCEVLEFRRELNMREGTLSRKFRTRLKNDVEVEVSSLRFVSMDDYETACIDYQIKVLRGSGEIKIISSINADVVNEDSNYDEQFWEVKSRESLNSESVIISSTKKTQFDVAVAMSNKFSINGLAQKNNQTQENSSKIVSRSFSSDINIGDSIRIIKYVAVLSSQNHPKDSLGQMAFEKVRANVATGFDALLSSHENAWAKIWDKSDVVIKGDKSAQQGIRFNIFHLYQTYKGDDPRLNIGPKGFTGEKYGGSTYWDTEAFGLPFYLNTAESDVARNLLIYRYNHLEKAIENAEKLGFNNGAALYPMVTMNGEECHNEWEITFEEIHRNGSIAFAISRYINHTGDEDYLVDFGLEVLIAISRFWSQRVNFSEEKQLYVILGVTGPNEYENNVNNNWYTNKIASWTLSYTLESLDKALTISNKKYRNIIEKTGLSKDETSLWKRIIDNMYFPVDENTGIILQQDGYMDKEQLFSTDLDPEERPINQNWSWDRILRSCFIKQADVLQGIYNFEEEFSIDTIKKNYDFYEPRTVHESSLSPSVYSIIACLVGYVDKAYDLYLRTARQDLDDYNKEAREGLHITSMAGTWLSIVEGFGGMRIRNKRLHLNPIIPDAWDSYSFNMRFNGCLLEITIFNGSVTINNKSDEILPVVIKGNESVLDPNKIETYNI